MYKRYYKRRENEGGELERIMSGILGLGLMYLAFTYYLSREKFWQQMNSFVFPLIGLIVLGVIGYLFYLKKVNEKNNNKFEDIIKNIKDNGFEDSVKNFIERFGKEGKFKSWTYRDYKFDWKRLEDFRETVINNKIDITKEDYSDLLHILKYYIDEKEKNFLNKRIETKVSNNLNELSKNGDDFENLVVRLYTAMGYASKRIGGHGDQGGDVIASKNGENILIQAKYYQGSVGNAAVQQAAAAMPHYGCTKAVVITTSYFTSEAITLAKSNSVELIDGNDLKYKLLEYLKENWQ
jgi:HJR/Mrr/RecB family endonuclease